MVKRSIRLMVLGFLLITLEGCGKKGPIGPPPDEVSTYPRIYPQPIPDESPREEDMTAKNPHSQ